MNFWVWMWLGAYFALLAGVAAYFHWGPKRTPSPARPRHPWQF